MVANLALVTGVVDDDLFAVMLVAVVLTTVAAPYLLAWAVPRAKAETERADGGRDAGDGPGRLNGDRVVRRVSGAPDGSAAAEEPPAAALGAGRAATRRPCCRSRASISDW